MKKTDTKLDVNRGVILAAGYGTRFLPVTKTIPKEMLPIIDVPCIDYIVREFIESGITKILIITSRRKKALEDYFDKEVELEDFLNSNKKELKKKVAGFNATFSFIRQEQMAGTGDALLMTEDFTHREPFVVAYPDDVVISKKPLSLNLVATFKQTNKSVIALDKVKAKDCGRYGVVETQIDNGQIIVKSIDEKAGKQKSGTVMVSIGRYLFTNEVYDLLRLKSGENIKEGASQTFMINSLADADRLAGFEIEGVRYDLGQPDGYVKAITHAALQHKDLKGEYKKYLISLVKTF